MSKVHPHQLALLSPPPPSSSSPPSSPSSSSSSSSLSCSNTTGEIFTIWMKSLILGGKGCTVFDSNGQVVYRVDNYCSKSCDQVFLMDSHGHVLLTILRKKFRLLAHWKGYREEKKKGATWWFRVRKSWIMTKMSLQCKIVVDLNHDNASSTFKIEKGKSKSSSSSSSSSSSCRIVDKLGGVIAEMKRKESVGGVVLGDDVLTMVVEPNIDLSLIMGLVVSHSLICSRI